MQPIFLNRKDSAQLLSIGVDKFDRDVRPYITEIKWEGKTLFKVCELETFAVTIEQRWGRLTDQKGDVRICQDVKKVVSDSMVGIIKSENPSRARSLPVRPDLPDEGMPKPILKHGIGSNSKRSKGRVKPGPSFQKQKTEDLDSFLLLLESISNDARRSQG